MKTGEKVVFGCWVLSSSPLGMCVTNLPFQHSVSEILLLRNWATSVFSELFLVDGISSSWASSSEKWLFFLLWENKLWIWVGWGWRIHLQVNLLTFRWDPLWLLSFFWGGQAEVGGTWVFGIGGETRQQQRLPASNTEWKELGSCWFSFFWWWELSLASLKGLY